MEGVHVARETVERGPAGSLDCDLLTRHVGLLARDAGFCARGLLLEVGSHIL